MAEAGLMLELLDKPRQPHEGFHLPLHAVPSLVRARLREWPSQYDLVDVFESGRTRLCKNRARFYRMKGVYHFKVIHKDDA